MTTFIWLFVLALVIPTVAVLILAGKKKKDVSPTGFPKDAVGDAVEPVKVPLDKTPIEEPKEEVKDPPILPVEVDDQDLPPVKEPIKTPVYEIDERPVRNPDTIDLPNPIDWENLTCEETAEKIEEIKNLLLTSKWSDYRIYDFWVNELETGERYWVARCTFDK